MRELYPNPATDVDPVERYGADDRRAPGGDRPWVLVNMIATVDGATAIDGRSGGLGGPADKVVFGAIRAVADVILVGAGTVRAESYGSPRTPPGGGAPPRLAIVTRSLDIDPTSAVFTDAPAEPPTDRGHHRTKRRRASPGRWQPSPRSWSPATTTSTSRWRSSKLAAQGVRVVLCEGGPSLNGHLVAAGVLDELCLSLAPLVAGGSSPRLAHGLAPPHVTADAVGPRARIGRHAVPSLRTGRCGRFRQCRQCCFGAVAFVSKRELALEVGGLVEALVDAGEPDVGDVIHLAEMVEHQQTDPLRRHFAGPDELLLDGGGDRLELVVGQRS